MEENKQHSSMHIAALVLGIISIVTCWFWYITVPTGIMAIIFGIKSAKKLGSKMGKAGMITGIIGLSLFALSYISLIAMILVFAY